MSLLNFRKLTVRLVLCNVFLFTYNSLYHRLLAVQRRLIMYSVASVCLSVCLSLSVHNHFM